MKTLIYIKENAESVEIDNVLEYLKEHEISHNLSFVKTLQQFDEYVANNFESIQPYERIVMYDITHVTSTPGAFVSLINQISQRSVEIHFSKYKYVFPKASNLSDFIAFFNHATADVIIATPAGGLHHKEYKTPGRPKGAKNKALMLDRFKDEIQEYLSNGHSHSSIARLINCHPQTVKAWLDYRNSNGNA